ncbi:hypothetical protein [Thioclava sp. GXIMD2076]|uniref:Uncharacterized protein n=1 Tax=Thioclava kandeliae TaxID=3070818 RepID=A0ABV1SEM1_9RHOB
MPSPNLQLIGRPASPEEQALQDIERERLRQGVMDHPLIRQQPEGAQTALVAVDPQGGAL